MSQIIKTLTSGGPIPPNIPTSFVTDVGTVIPSGNIVNVNGGSGVQVIANPNLSNNMVINITGGALTGTAQTIGATTANISVNIPIPTSESVINIQVNLTGYAKASGIALGGELTGTVRNVGGLLTVIQIPELTKNNDSSLATWSATFVISGTNVLVQVSGVATFTINWTAIIDFVTATEAQA